VPLTDAGARGDPLVAGIDEFLQIGVGNDLLGEVAAGAGNACVDQDRISPEKPARARPWARIALPAA